METQLSTWEKKRSIAYSELIEFAKDVRFPSVTFTPLAQKGMFDLLAKGSNEDTRLKIARRADRSLSLNDPYPWTGSIFLMEDGQARLYGVRELSHATALRRIRKEYLK